MFAAAFCLGCLCVGNPQKYIPFVVSHLGSGDYNKVVMLTAVKEAVNRCASSGNAELLIPHVQSSILPLLVSLANQANEAARVKVQDCLGKLLKMAPVEVMDCLTSSSSSGDPLVVASTFESFRYYTNTDEATDDMVVPAFISLATASISHPELEPRRAVVSALSTLVPKPAYFRAADAAAVETLVQAVLSECATTHVVEEQLGNEKIKTDYAAPNRAAAFVCLGRLLENLEDKVSVAECMKAAVTGCGDSDVEPKVAALSVVSSLAQTSSNLLSEYVGSLKDTVLASIKASRVIKKDDPSKFPVIKAFVMEIRDILQSFKESEPSHAVHEELEMGLDKQRADWAKSKVPATRLLVSLIDEFRGLAIEAGAEAEV